MFNALFYLWWNSLKNRTTMRFKRLNQPKYLIGFIVGALYFYWYFFRFVIGPAQRTNYGSAQSFDPLMLEAIGAFVLCVIVLLAWVIPHKRASLTFTEAEVAFLFPAPVTRQTLIHFKLVRSQVSIFFGVFFLTIVSRRFDLNADAWIRAISWWMILSVLNLHFLASSFAMTKLMDNGISSLKRRIIVLGLAGAAIAWVVIWTKQSMPTLTDSDMANAQTLSDYAKQALTSGPLLYLLYPFRLIVRPMLTHDGLTFANAVWPPLLILAAHYLWVMRADVSFEEASIDASRKQAEKVAAMRAGNWRGAGKTPKQKRAPFKLNPMGTPAMALFWKNLINAGNLMSFRLWLVLIIVAVSMCSGLRTSGNNWPTLIGMFATMFCAWLLMVGAQFVRQDFRQDLKQMDILKVFPVRSWEIALGEILAPAVILTAVHWLLIIIALTCLVPHPPAKMAGELVLAIGLSAALIFPCLNFIALIIPNAAVLLFPAWFQSATDAPRGIEAMGQRLVFAIGQFLAFIIALAPAAGVFAANLFIVRWLAGSMTVAIVTSSLSASVVLVVEVGFGVVLLGWLFKRFDVSGEPTA